MKNLFEILSAPVVQNLGWTLIHSLWQGLICLLMVIALLRFIPSGKSSLRYAVSTLGLLVLFITSIVTFLWLSDPVVQSINGPVSGHLASFSPAVPVESSFVESLIEGMLNLISANLYLFVITWGIGALLFSLRIVAGYWYIDKLRRTSILVDSQWQLRIAELASEIGIHQEVKLAYSPLINSPLVIGYLKPVVLVPLGMLSGLSTDQLESIFIHELIHIRRGDYLINLAQSFFEAIYFFNPFAWVISTFIRREREYCCDDSVVMIHGNPLTYARALASLEQARLSRMGVALSLAENKNQLMHRIKRIMEKSVQSYSGRERFIPVALLMVGLMCASWITIQSRDQDMNGSQNSFTLKAPVAGADTSKKEKSMRYYKRSITTTDENGEPKEEIIVEFDGDFDLSMVDPMVAIEPLEPIAPIEFNIPAIPSIPVLSEVPVAPFDFSYHFNMDTLHPGIHHDWDEFGREFEKMFKENFEDFYKNHEQEVKRLMEKVEEKLNSSEDYHAMEQKLRQFSERDAELAMHESELMRDQIAAAMSKISMSHSELAFADQAKQAMRLAESLHAQQAHLTDMAHDMKAWSDDMHIVQEKLKKELVKDGYLKSDEEINSMDISDDGMTINGKKIKVEDEKRYRKIFNSLEKPRPGRRE